MATPELATLDDAFSGAKAALYALKAAATATAHAAETTGQRVAAENLLRRVTVIERQIEDTVGQDVELVARAFEARS